MGEKSIQTVLMRYLNILLFLCISFLNLKANNIISNEIVNDNKFSWLNGYYDNKGKKVTAGKQQLERKSL